MRLLVVLWTALVLAAFSFAGCENGGAAPPPEAKLFADPEVCDVPCEVVLDSSLTDSGGKTLTFTWDLGDGPIPGDARLLHTFETAGTYEVTITVSDGSGTTTDTVGVRAEPQPKTSATIDETGGTASQGAAQITVPAEVAPEPVVVELTELPSMQADAERLLRIGQFTALGSAYQVSTPLKTSIAIDIAVTDSEAVGKAPEDLAWLVRYVARPVPRPDDPDILSRAPLASYGLVPVTQVDEDGTVHGEIFGRKRFQLVTLAEPMIVDSFEVEAATPAAKSSTATKAPNVPLVITVFNEVLDPGWEAVGAVIHSAIDEIYKVLVGQKHFVPPSGTLTIIVGEMKNPKYKGYVMVNDFNTIYLNYTMFDSDKISKVLAHEFFHLIQNYGSNQASRSGQTRQRDPWFKEGTAEWACDEVFDDSLDYYHATTWRRFEVPLNQEGYKDANEYRTVGFWKWAESVESDIISNVIADKFLLTHKFSGPNSIIENSIATDYLTSLMTIWQDVDFLQYTHAARYQKDFDTGENRKGELWDGEPYLGPPKKVYADPSKLGEIEAGIAGDSEDNPLTIPFNLKQHLTADVHRVGSPNLEGDLHIRLPNTGSAPIEAEILILDRETGEVEDVMIAPNLANGPVDFVSKDFDSDKEAVLLIVDPRWGYDSADKPIKGDVEYWIADPCGPIPPGGVEVSTTDDLIAAAKNPGTIIKLAPGEYAPPIGSWDTDQYGPFDANLLLENITLIGAGEGATTLVLQGGDLAALYGYKNTTLRNLTVDALSGSQVASLDHRDLTMCNVTFNFSSSAAWGIILNPWHGGSTSFNMYESSMIHPPGGTRGSGVFLQTCSSPDAVNLSATIKESEFSGWYVAVEYYTGYGSCGSISVDTDCLGFSGNTWNVLESYCPAEGEPCQGIDHCPNP